MRVVFACLALALFTGSAAAQQTTQQVPTPSALDQVYACAQITDDHQRLACYDGAVGRLHEAQTSGNLVAVDREQARQINREAFGFQLPSLPRLFGGHHDEEVIQEIHAQIARVGYHADGKAVFTLDNGQVWVQIDTNNTGRARSGGGVTIHRAAVGSFLMSVDAGGPAIRVHRQD